MADHILSVSKERIAKELASIQDPFSAIAVALSDQLKAGSQKGLSEIIETMTLINKRLKGLIIQMLDPSIQEGQPIGDMKLSAFCKGLFDIQQGLEQLAEQLAKQGISDKASDIQNFALTISSFVENELPKRQTPIAIPFDDKQLKKKSRKWILDNFNFDSLSSSERKLSQEFIKKLLMLTHTFGTRSPFIKVQAEECLRSCGLLLPKEKITQFIGEMNQKGFIIEPKPGQRRTMYSLSHKSLELYLKGFQKT